jgi:hypothetical protein
MNIAEMSMNSKVSLLKELYNDIASKGQDGDTLLAHINPYEAELLKAHGGSGTINPTTGLPEFKSVAKTVVRTAKKVAPYVATAAAVYYGGPALASSLGGPTATVGSTAFWQGANTATSGFGLGSLTSGLSFGNVMQGVSTASSLGGLALQAQGNIQSQKYASQAAGFQRQQVEAANKSDEVRNRYNQLQNKRQRLAAIRQARIQQAAMSGSMGNVLGQGGTSGYVGAIGSLGSQASANIGNVNVAEGFGNEISRLNTMSANYGSQANTAGSKGTMWSDVSVLGSTLFKDSDKIANLANKIFT